MARLVAGKSYLVDDDFHAESDAELSVTKGNVVTVLEAEDPDNPGWIFVSLADRQGYVPSDFLVEDQGMFAQQQQIPPPQQQQIPPPQAMYSAAPPPAISAQQYGQSGAAFNAGNVGGSMRNVYEYSSEMPAYGAPPPALGSYGSSSGLPPPALGAPGGAPQPPQAAAPHSSYYETSAVRKPTAEDDEIFRSEQRVISIELWQFREELLGSGQFPDPPSRRWFYRDFFDDMQGPFNAKEMKERLGKEYIKDDSKVIMTTGTGELAKEEEEVLRDLFRSPEAAFLEMPRLTKIGGKCWYFLGKEGKETGPFNNEQMKAWFDAGYFGGNTLVRLANGRSTMTPLKDVYADPANSFHAPPNLPQADLLAFPGHRTAVLSRDPHMKKRKSEQPTTMDTEKVQVEFDTPEPTAKPEKDADGAAAASQSKKNPNMQIYGTGYPKFAGIPSPHSLKQNVYSSLLYTFVTRPLHPEAGTVQMYIRRDIDGSHINFNKYVLFLEETNTPIMAAFRHHHNIHNYFDIKLSTTGKLQDNARGLTIANLELNFIGTTFLLHNDVPGHQGNARDLCCVTYERNRVSNKGPRKMKVGIPSVREDKPEFVEWKHDGIKNAPMVQALKSVATKDLIPLLNKPPRWNEKKKAYMLDFKGRVTRSSVKNFQLVDAMRDPDHKSVLLQHGRVGVNRFTLDVQHPLSILQGFAIALSSLHSKKGVD